MKRMLLIVCGLLTTAVVAAQTDTLANTREVYVMKYVVKNPVDSELQFAVGGYQIALGNREKQLPKVRSSFGFGNVEFGFGILTTPSYAGYPLASGDFLAQRVGKSIHFGFRPFGLEVPINPRRTVYFSTGVHFMCDNYVFNENITLARVGGMILPIPLDRDYKKSKLTTASFGIPVQFAFRPAKHLSLAVMAYGDVVCNVHTKYKKPNTKSRLSGVNEWQAGVGVSATYHKVGVYAKYGLTSFFRSGAGPKTHPLTVGLLFGM